MLKLFLFKVTLCESVLHLKESENVYFKGDQTIDSGEHGAGANATQGRKQQELKLIRCW